MKPRLNVVWNEVYCKRCLICVEVCPFDALAFSHDYNLTGYRREDFHFDLVKELMKRKKAQ